MRNRRTSISLEDRFWDSLNAIVRMENITIGKFIERIKAQRQSINLSSSLRVAVLEYYQRLAASHVEAHSESEVAVQSETDSDPREHGGQSQPSDKTAGFWSGTERRQSLLVAAHEVPR